MAGGARVVNNTACGSINFGTNHTDGDFSNVAYAACIQAITEGNAESVTNMPVAIAFRAGSAGTDLDTANQNIGTEVARVRSDGRFQVADSIVFGNNTAANEEFVYERGTLTLGLRSTGNLVDNIGTSGATYVRNGRVVTIFSSFSINSASPAGHSGNLVLVGFPTFGLSGIRTSVSAPIAYNGNHGLYLSQLDWPDTFTYFKLSDSPDGSQPIAVFSGAPNIRIYFTMTYLLNN